MQALEKIIKAAANRRRLAILGYLQRHGEATVGDIAEAIHLSFKATSKHLRILYAVDIVEQDKRSLMVYHTLAIHQHPIIKQILSLL